MYSKFFNILLKIVSPLCKNILNNFFLPITFEKNKIKWLLTWTIKKIIYIYFQIIRHLIFTTFHTFHFKVKDILTLSFLYLFFLIIIIIIVIIINNLSNKNNINIAIYNNIIINYKLLF